MNHDNTITYFNLDRVEITDMNLSFMNSSPRTCLLCTKTIKERGGPGRSICTPCGTDLLAGKLRGLVDRSAEDLKAG